MFSHSSKLRQLLSIVLCCAAFSIYFALPALGVPKSVPLWEYNTINDRWLGAVIVPDDPPGWEGKIPQSEIKKIREAGELINKFAFKLYPLMAADIEGNILFSPYNLAMTLIREYEGADGRTKRELKKILAINGGLVKNFAHLDEIIKKTPEDRGEFYSAGENTYFKSDWEFPFYNYEEWYKLTEMTKSDFHKPNGEIQTIGIMYQYQRVKYYEDDAVKSFEFPFVDRYYSYIIILPKSRRDERRVGETLTYEKYLSLISKQKDRNLIVRIVDTKINSQYSFDNWLDILGVSRVEKGKLKQKNVINIYGGEQSRAVRTFWDTCFISGPAIRVNAFGETGQPSPHIYEGWDKLYNFNVDKKFFPTHSFIYFIVDNRSGAILLMGRYCGREQNENILSW